VDSYVVNSIAGYRSIILDWGELVFLINRSVLVVVIECAEKNHPRGARRGICGGVGVAHTPTYTDPPLAVDLFSVDLVIIE